MEYPSPSLRSMAPAWESYLLEVPSTRVLKSPRAFFRAARAPAGANGALAIFVLASMGRCSASVGDVTLARRLRPKCGAPPPCATRTTAPRAPGHLRAVARTSLYRCRSADSLVDGVRIVVRELYRYSQRIVFSVHDGDDDANAVPLKHPNVFPNFDFFAGADAEPNADAQ